MNPTSDDLTIRIDNIHFQLKRLVRVNLQYPQVVEIGVIDNDTNLQKSSFWAYRSNSELGMWRFCITRAKDISSLRDYGWYKGKYDYVQSTLLHFTLQNFINENLDMIPFDEELSKSNYEMTNACVCSVNSSKCKTIQTVKIIDNPERIISESPFKDINYKDESLGIGCGRLDNTETTYSQLSGVLREFTEQFRNEYDITNIKLLTHNYLFTFIGIIHIEGDIYSVELHRKTPRPESKTNSVLLYFMVAKLKTSIVDETHRFYQNITKICGKDYHVFPFLIVPSDARINEIGLYDKYIPCGLYICKLFDYSMTNAEQCTKEEVETGRCSQQYSYIGNRYDNMFPLKEALDFIKENAQCELDFHTPPGEEDIHSSEYGTPTSMPSFSFDEDNRERRRRRRRRKTKKPIKLRKKLLSKKRKMISTIRKRRKSRPSSSWNTVDTFSTK
jgi:hypothetical protein